MADQTSLLSIRPVTPVFGGIPIGDLGETLLVGRHWLLGLDIFFGAEADEIAVRLLSASEPVIRFGRTMRSTTMFWNRCYQLQAWDLPIKPQDAWKVTPVPSVA